MEPHSQAPETVQSQVLASPNGTVAPPTGQGPPRQAAPLAKTAEQRKEALAQQIQTVVGQGYRIDTQSDFQAVLVKGKPVNHKLHGIISVVTLGAWLVPWLITVVAGGEERVVLAVDESGNVPIQKL